MRVFLLQVWFELKLLFKLRWTLLLPPAAGVWMLIQCSEINMPNPSDLNLYASEAHMQLIALLTTVPVITGVLLIRRDIFNPTYEWSLSLPVTNRVFIGSKWLAGLLYCSLFTCFIQLAYVLVALDNGLPWTSIIRNLSFYTVQYETSFGISLALGIIIGALMPLRFALPIAFCGWIFGSLFVPVFLTTLFNMYPINAFSLNHTIGASGNAINGTWDFQLQKMESLLLFIINAAFALFMLCASVALLTRIRPVKRPKAPYLIMWTALLVAIASLVPYSGLWADRFERQSHIEAASSTAVLHQEPYMFKITSMALDVTRLPDNSLWFKAAIVLPTGKGALLPSAPGVTEVRLHNPGQATFLLYPNLQVTHLTVDGKSVTWQQNNDRVSFAIAALHPDQDEHLVELEYKGTLNEWAQDVSSPYYRAFVEDKNVFLPTSIGWFPIPGGSGLFTTNHTIIRNRQDMLQYINAEIDLKMAGFPGKLFASIPEADDDKPEARHWRQAAANQLNVIGGNFEKVSIPGEPISIITTPGSVESSRKFLESIKERRAFYEQWTGKPLTALRQIFYFPMRDTFNTLHESKAYLADDTLYITQTIYSTIEQSLERVMNLLLFGDIVSNYILISDWDNQNKQMEQTYSIVQELRLVITNYVWSKEKGMNYSFPYYNSPLHYKMAELVDTAYKDGKQELVRRVLLHFMEQGLGIQENYSYDADVAADPQTAQLYHNELITWDQWLKVWNEEKGR